GFSGNLVGILPVAHPSHKDFSFSSVRKSHAGIIVLSKIYPPNFFIHGSKSLSIKIPQKVLGSGSSVRSSRVDADQQGPYHFPILVETDQIRAFPNPTMSAYVFPKFT